MTGDESKLIYLPGDRTAEDDRDRGSLYENIALAYSKLGAFGQSLAVTQSIEDTQLRDHVVERSSCYRDI